jgi:hypothetical protein
MFIAALMFYQDLTLVSHAQDYHAFTLDSTFISLAELEDLVCRTRDVLVNSLVIAC